MSANFLLVNNGVHPGIAAVGHAYKRAFEYLGLCFHYIEMRSYPKMSYEQMNAILIAHLASFQFDFVVMIQPTWIYSTLFQIILNIKQLGRTKFISVQTEDPYALEGILQMVPAFNYYFTNEKLVAEKYGNLGFHYLPVGFDSLQPYKHIDKKNIDVTLLCSYYKNRINYKNELMKLDCKKFIGGSMGYASKYNLPINITGFNIPQGLIARHNEYQLYSDSKFVLNPHRRPTVTGIFNLRSPDKRCEVVMNKAISPNPRFYDALGCGAFPLNDESRTECTAILDTYAKEWLPEEWKSIPSLDNMKLIEEYILDWDKYESHMKVLADKIISNESYISRAEKLLGVINA